ncbi:hypothetical protein RJT34_22533 [Clitoria ternatea]|uniref:Uncharacterized protein n=1 Tax=Clitoria ternatea TaxID=43366 RepID=A0AAN9FKX3_CLITE
MIRSYFAEKIQKGLSVFAQRRPALNYLSEAKGLMAAEVREGCFAVLAIKGGETKRFIIGLDYLTDPAFLGLLDQAQEEFGFTHKGALAVPCQPQELQNILDARKV